MGINKLSHTFLHFFIKTSTKHQQKQQLMGGKKFEDVGLSHFCDATSHLNLNEKMMSLIKKEQVTSTTLVQNKNKWLRNKHTLHFIGFSSLSQWCSSAPAT